MGASSVLGLHWADLLKARAIAGHVNGSAKSVIFIWLLGGPAQLDTFDHKPIAPAESRGPFSTDWADICARLLQCRLRHEE